MSICPFAQWEPIPENATQRRITPTTAIMHTNGSPAKDLHDYFARPDIVVEAHFQVRCDGALLQYLDTGVMADANLGANPFAISIETEDGGDPNTPWTPAQVATIRRLLLWLHDEHGIALTRCTSPAGGGIGWHSMWGFRDPINLLGAVANPWSPSFGKVCPGKVRIGQLVNDIIPTLIPGGDDMLDSPTLSNAQFVDDCYARILGGPGDPAGRAFWTGKLDRNEMTRGDVRFEFSVVKNAARDAALAALVNRPAVVAAAPDMAVFLKAAEQKFYADIAAFASKQAQA